MSYKPESSQTVQTFATCYLAKDDRA